MRNLMCTSRALIYCVILVKPYSTDQLRKLRTVQRSNLRTDDLGQKRTRSISFLDTSPPINDYKKSIAKFNGKQHPHVSHVFYFKQDWQFVKSTVNHLQGMLITVKQNDKCIDSHNRSTTLC